MSEQASVEAKRAALHMAEVEDQCQEVLRGVDLAIDALKELLGRSGLHDQ